MLIKTFSVNLFLKQCQNFIEFPSFNQLKVDQEGSISMKP